MRNTFLFSLLALVVFLSACKDDVVDDLPIDYDYHAHIHEPSAGNKQMNGTLHIEVGFESHTGEVVHNVNVRIYNKLDNTEVFNMPTSHHVHAMGGSYDFHEHITLSTANGFAPNTDWTLEASVWGEEGIEDGFEMESLDFHID